MKDPVKMNVKLKPGYENAIGKPIYITPNKVKVGEIVEYNKETGEAVIEVEYDVWDKVFTKVVSYSVPSGDSLSPTNNLN